MFLRGIGKMSVVKVAIVVFCLVVEAEGGSGVVCRAECLGKAVAVHPYLSRKQA